VTDEERQDVKAKLIEMGFWGANKAGDPLTRKEDASVVRERLEGRLAATAFLGSQGYVGGALARHIYVVRGEFNYPIADGDTYSEAICLAALALPEFLKRHPECAADQK
jgi:hypothetical protein